MNRNVLPLTLILILAACGAAAVNPTPSPQASSAREGVWPDEGPRTWAPRATETAITANDLRTRVYQIADDSMMGRRIGELGNLKTTEYIAAEFKRLGLKPGGDNGTYFQTLAYGVTGFDSAQARMSAGGAALVVKQEWLPLSPVSAQNAPTVYAGRWGDVNATLDPSVVRGKIAVFSAPTLPPAAAGGRAGGVRGGAGGFAAVSDARARAAGAVAVFVVSLDSVPATAMTTTFNTTRNGMRIEVGGGIGAAAITDAAAAKIFGAPVAGLAVGTTGRPVTASWAYDTRRSTYPAHNVIAILPGSDPARAGEYVLVGAHNDHVGVNPVVVEHDSLRAYNRVMKPQGANDRSATPPTAGQKQRIDSMIARARSIRAPRLDSIMNGADDDASGTAVLMEIAEQFAKERPARSIIFISHQGEEGGLMGSKWFVDHPTVPLKQIVAAINMDMLGKGRVTDVRFGGPNSVQSLGSRRIAPQFGEIIDSVNAISPRPMAIDKSWDVPANPLNRFCRSDQVNYVNNDIPTVYFSLGYSIDYHMQTDEPQYIDYEHGERLGQFVHQLMTAVANRVHRPLVVGQDTLYPSCR